eukprot:7378466-Prymnesium_polylepis.2
MLFEASLAQNTAGYPNDLTAYYTPACDAIGDAEANEACEIAKMPSSLPCRQRRTRRAVR